MPTCRFGDIKSLENIIFSRPIHSKGKRRKGRIHPARNSSGASNPAETILKSNPAAEQQDIISNGVNKTLEKEDQAVD
jgi:hypothetical protein